MALPDIVANSAFWEGLRVRRSRFVLPPSQQITRSAGGDVARAKLGARLWTATVTLAPMLPEDADGARAMIRYLQQVGTACLIRPRPRLGPIADPRGSILDGAAVQIHTLIGMRELRLSGLPTGYTLTAGDYLSFTYLSSPTRYAFHQIVVGGIADGFGVTDALEVVPPIRPGAVVGRAVRLVRPWMKAIITDADTGDDDLVVSEGITLTMQQTLRG